ncbi:hypothetical protein TSAR_010402, partial [Trichomalopsis sarcophagae]
INKTMDVLNQAGKNPSYLPTKRLRNLEVNKSYLITDVKKVATRFGMKIILFDVFLPTRVNAILVEKEEAYNNFKDDTKKREVRLKYLDNCLIEFI